VFRFLKRLLIVAGIGAVAKKVMDSRSQSSGSSGSAQWPPIKPSGSKPA
jgi:hypothetical protein